MIHPGEIRDAAAELRAAPQVSNFDALGDALAALKEPSHVDAASTASGLSKEMTRWAIQSSIAAVDEESVQQIVALKSTSKPLVDVLGIVLASNVFTACIRAVLPALLMDLAVVIKASSRDDVFPRAFCRALPEDMRKRVRIFTFDRDNSTTRREFMDVVDAVHVYGSDETTASFANYATSTRVTQHGHGIGAVLCGNMTENVLPFARKMALDIVAYDQRGCLSPKVIWTTGDCDTLACALVEELEYWERKIPRGSLTELCRIESMQWKSTVESLGSLVSKRSAPFGVGVQDSVQLPLGPGYRHIVVRPYDPADLQELRPFLKVVGVCGGTSHVDLTQLRTCPVGEMQKPSLCTSQDGNPLFHGMER